MFHHTLYVCRCIFGFNMAKSDMNPKTIQYIILWDIQINLNTYADLQFEDTLDERKESVN